MADEGRKGLVESLTNERFGYLRWKQQRGCDRKIGYHCELDANAAILRSYEKGDGPLRTYECGFCGLLHLTSDVTEESA